MSTSTPAVELLARSRRPECDRCGMLATVTLTAAYPSDERAIHPEWATYPAPMFRACWHCLPNLLSGDAGAPAATPAYLLRLA